MSVSVLRPACLHQGPLCALSTATRPTRRRGAPLCCKPRKTASAAISRVCLLFCLPASAYRASDRLRGDRALLRVGRGDGRRLHACRVDEEL